MTATEAVKNNLTPAFQGFPQAHPHTPHGGAPGDRRRGLLFAEASFTTGQVIAVRRLRSGLPGIRRYADDEENKLNPNREQRTQPASILHRIGVCFKFFIIDAD